MITSEIMPDHRDWVDYWWRPAPGIKMSRGLWVNSNFRGWFTLELGG